jgi:hypothetical protein
VSNPYTASFVLASIRRRGWFPTGEDGFTTVDGFALMNEESRVYVTSVLKSCREEYLVNEQDHDVAFTAGQAQVRVPSRCVGSALRSIWILDSSDEPQPLNRIEPERQHLYPGRGSPVGYVLRGNTIQLLPAPDAAGTLRLGYLQRLSTVVAEDACGLITAINTLTREVTLSALPSTFTVAETYDLVQGEPPFSALAIDQTVTIAGSVLTFSSVPDDLAVGDYVCLAGETPIVQLPLECHALLAQRVTVKVLEAQGGPRYDAAKASLDEMKADVLRLLSPRVTGSTRPIINPNGPGMRRGR